VGVLCFFTALPLCHSVFWYALLSEYCAGLNTVVLDNDLRIQSSQIGRSRLTVGLALSAQLTDNAIFLLSVNNQFASNWNVLSTISNLTVRF